MRKNKFKGTLIKIIIEKLGKDIDCINLIEQLPTRRAQIEKSFTVLKESFNWFKNINLGEIPDDS